MAQNVKTMAPWADFCSAILRLKTVGSDLPDQLRQFLRAAAGHFPDRLSTAEAVCRHHANTVTLVRSEPPSAVVWPETTEEVAHIVRLAAEYTVPLIAFGGGTSLEGHVNAPMGGVSVDLSRMDSVLAVRPEDMDCTVQAGVTLERLNTGLRATGLFFPVDPGSGQATLGGMASTRASGTTTVRYGSMRVNVLSLTAVLASGQVIKTARRARKSAAGYDLTHLLVGAEGTLGIITELTLKLHGVPDTVLSAVAGFDTLDGACRASTLAIQAGLAMARIELLDAMQIHCVNAAAGMSMVERPTLFVEFHGSAPACRADYQAFAEIAQGEGGHDLASATSEDERRRLWKARHDALWAVKTMWPGRQVIVTDIAVPLSAMAACVSATAADIAASNLIAPIVGHVGDGNFHAIVAIDPDNASERERVEGFLERLVARAHAAEGTATGEHGVGQGKKSYMAAEHGEALDTMRAIKSALDPLGIFNPGKIF
jgi:D-lactate dehydrogenase (cytochrome)